MGFRNAFLLLLGLTTLGATVAQETVEEPLTLETVESGIDVYLQLLQIQTVELPEGLESSTFKRRTIKLPTGCQLAVSSHPTTFAETPRRRSSILQRGWPYGLHGRNIRE